tara:strand:- start:17301 stop:18725 length:1425 start_codon:yes stop_codon:yes gene_type:complete
MALAFQGGAFGSTTDYNFITSLDLHKPEYDTELTERYGDQNLSGFLTMIGAEKGVSSLEYNHFEEERIYPKISVAAAAAGVANTAKALTLQANSTIAIPNNASPYIATAASTKQFVTPRDNDLIMIKPFSGTASSGTYVKAIVSNVVKAAGTFDATPIILGEAIPQVAAGSEIVIYGNAAGEGSGQPEARISRTVKYTNNLQTIKETYEITGTEKNIVTWIDFKGKNGEKGRVAKLKGESDTYKRFMTAKELTLLVGDKLTNTTVGNTFVSEGTPLALTEGLIPFVLSQGNTSNYSVGTGWDKQKAESLVKTLDKQKGSKKNLMPCGINLSMQIDDTLGDYSNDGQIQYGSYDFGSDASRNFQFSSFKYGNYTFDKKTFDVFNDLQTLGADGYGYPDEGMVIPMDKKIDKGSNSQVQSLRLRYLADPETGASSARSEVVDQFKVNGTDKFSVYYKADCGFEGFAGNRFAYIKKS